MFMFVQQKSCKILYKIIIINHLPKSSHYHLTKTTKLFKLINTEENLEKQHNTLTTIT